MWFLWHSRWRTWDGRAVIYADAYMVKSWFSGRPWTTTRLPSWCLVTSHSVTSHITPQPSILYTQAAGWCISQLAENRECPRLPEYFVPIVSPGLLKLMWDNPFVLTPFWMTLKRANFHQEDMTHGVRTRRGGQVFKRFMHFDFQFIIGFEDLCIHIDRW